MSLILTDIPDGELDEFGGVSCLSMGALYYTGKFVDS
jgi:hypothetical protein